MSRHQKDQYYVVGEGVRCWKEGKPACRRPSTAEEIRRFRFSRLVPGDAANGGPASRPIDPGLARALAKAMTLDGAPFDDDAGPDSNVPAGFTYLGQFIDHDLTFDRTDVALGTEVNVGDLLQGRSPSLDLDSLYGLGPSHPDSAVFYAEDGVSLKMGSTTRVPRRDAARGLPDLFGFDLPRRPRSSDRPGSALIPDHRNDENLAVAQTHLAFIRFHNRVVNDLGGHVPGLILFEKAREQVVKHYQWVLRHDYLPRVVNPEIVNDVFTNGRQFFEVAAPQEGPPDGHPYSAALPGDTPTMPIEFSVAAFRLGHSMIRGQYEWNSVFNSDGAEENPRHITEASLELLFTFSGTSGDLDFANRLPSNWIADLRRLYDFVTDANVNSGVFSAPRKGLNFAKRIDSLLVNPLGALRPGSIGGNPPEGIERNLAFRNLLRGNMVGLAGGQQAAGFFKVTPLDEQQILVGNNGANLNDLTLDQKNELVANTPLWFYILREAEFNGGRLGDVGGRIVAEVFHRAMEGSRHSIVTEPSWRPWLGPKPGVFTMAHLLLYAFEDNVELLNPVGD